MGVVVTLTEDEEDPGDLIAIKGMVLEGVTIEQRSFKQKTNSFWGVSGESRIYGGTGGRSIQIPVLIYDDSEGTPDFDTARKLADYIDYTLNTDGIGKNGILKWISESDHSEHVDCSFEGAMLSPGDSPKKDEAGTLGGGYFAMVLLLFRQLSNGAPEVEEEP